MFPSGFAFYGRFLSSRIVTAKHTTISSAMPMMEGRKYESVIDGVVVGCGVAVADAEFTMKLVCVVDGQYDSLPPNWAMTVYAPVMSGVHGKL